MFETREAAGQQLAEKIEQYIGGDTLVLVVPRGGMPVAYPIIKKYNVPYDFLIPRKIGAPYNEEFAIGAVAMDGTYTLDEHVVKAFRIPQSYIKEEVANQVEEIKKRMRVYRGTDEFPDVAGKTVLIIDDGIATGYTLLAGLRSLQKQKPKRIILVVPVGPADTIAWMEREVDDVIYLLAPHDFQAVGAYYRDFHQLTDEELLQYKEKLQK